jgi:hypothetical protein
MDLSANVFDVFNEDAKVVLCWDRNGMRTSWHCLGGATHVGSCARSRRTTGTERVTMNDLAKGPHVPQ